MTGVAVLAALTAAWLLIPEGRGLRLRRHSAVGVVASTPGSPRSRVPTALLGFGAGLAAFGLLLPRLLPWAVVVSIVALTGWWLGVRARDRRRRRSAEREVSHACLVLAGQLSIGQVPGVALANAAGDCAPLEESAATQRIGGDTGAALRRAGQEPGQEGLAELGVAWQLCERTGAPLAQVSTGVAEALRLAEAAHSSVDAELASARLTGQLLAVLPVLGLGLGFAGGGDPLGFLTGTLLGQVCVVAAVALLGAGLIWTEKLSEVEVQG